MTRLYVTIKPPYLVLLLLYSQIYPTRYQVSYKAKSYVLCGTIYQQDKDMIQDTGREYEPSTRVSTCYLVLYVIGCRRCRYTRYTRRTNKSKKHVKRLN